MIIWIILIIGLVGLDQLSKLLVVANFAAEQDTIPIIQDFFHLTYIRNSGMVFGLSEGFADKYWWVFLVVMSIAIVLFVYMFIKNDFRDKRLFWFSLSISLLIAGAFGNVIDRIFQPDHYVVDFIDFRGIWDFVFNIADICLNVGIGIFIIDQFFLEPKRTKANG